MGVPLPWLAYASRRPSGAVQKRILCSTCRSYPRPAPGYARAAFARPPRSSPRSSAPRSYRPASPFPGEECSSSDGLSSASAPFDPRDHVRGYTLDLASLVAQRPELDPLGARAGVAGQDLCAVLARADAEVVAEVVGIASQERREDVAEHALRLGAVLGHPGPHGDQGVREPLRIAAALDELRAQRLACGRELLRGRVVGGR